MSPTPCGVSPRKALPWVGAARSLVSEELLSCRKVAGNVYLSCVCWGWRVTVLTRSRWAW